MEEVDMKDTCERIQPMLSGYLDDELDDNERSQLEGHLATCTECKSELESMTELLVVSGTMEIDMPPDEVWDDFSEKVYNRLERRTGWMLLIIGTVALSLLGLYYLVLTDWASPSIKLPVEIGLAGILVLFVSVLRQRLFVRKSDRYSRDVRR
jgi:predicted anti-sigma-YlaC factor YlaD